MRARDAAVHVRIRLSQGAKSIHVNAVNDAILEVIYIAFAIMETNKPCKFHKVFLTGSCSSRCLHQSVEDPALDEHAASGSSIHLSQWPEIDKRDKSKLKAGNEALMELWTDATSIHSTSTVLPTVPKISQNYASPNFLLLTLHPAWGLNQR